MKRKLWTQHLVSALFAFALSVSGIGNIVTAYDLPVDSFGSIWLWCALFAFVSSLMFRFRYGGRCILFCAVLTVWDLWKKEALWNQTRFLGFLISSHYHDVYAWPVLGTPAASDVSLPLILWAALIALGVNWYICRRKYIIAVIVPVVLPLVLCLVTNDRVPDVGYLYVMILFLAILLITDWTRKKHPAQGMRLMLWMTIPVAVSLALLFFLNPREEYVNNAGKFQKEAMAWFQELQDTVESAGSDMTITAPASERVNLRAVGPKSRISHSLMRVNAPVGGTLYLRGRDYDQYTGTGWEASPDREEEFTAGSTSLGELTIITYGVRNMCYVPYYATREVKLVGGACENEENLQRYSYFLSSADSGNSGAPDPRYRELPEDTLAWAKEVVKQVTDGTESEKERILRIQSYVQNSAVYDLSTSRMGSDYGDFARWFLEESDTGYCVHFATAATVLLRAAGISARYVEGYMVTVTADSEVVVTNRNAHAWAEYFDVDSGVWRILEATPANPEDEENEPSVIATETETIPADTQTETETSGTEPNEPDDLPAKPPAAQDDPTGNAEDQGGKMKPFKAPAWLKAGFRCLLLIACVPLQGYVRLIRKRALWNRGRPNERTLTRWRQTRSLAKLLKQPFPEELDNLAQKAKFSQHRIQPEELKQFENYRDALIERIHNKPWYCRFVFKWILAVD